MLLGQFAESKSSHSAAYEIGCHQGVDYVLVHTHKVHLLKPITDVVACLLVLSKLNTWLAANELSGTLLFLAIDHTKILGFKGEKAKAQREDSA